MRYKYTLGVFLYTSLFALGIGAMVLNWQNVGNVKALSTIIIQKVPELNTQMLANEEGLKQLRQTEGSDVQSLQTQITDLTKGLNSLVSNIGGMPDQFDTVNKKIKSLTARLKALQKKHK